MCAPKAKFTTSVVLWTLGWILLIAGIVLFLLGGGFVKYVMHKAIRDSVVDANKITDSKYLNTETDFKFYLFHVDNARDVQVNGAQPILVEKGPYTYKKKSYKFDVSLEAGGTVVKYRQWSTYVPADGNTASTDVLVSINPLFTSAVGAKFGSQGALAAYSSSQAFVAIRDNLYLTNTSSVISSLRLLTIPIYLGAVKATLNGMGLNDSTVIGQWAKLSYAGVPLATTNAALAGFEIGAAGSPQLSLSQATVLWTNPSLGLTSSSGMSVWATALPVCSTLASPTNCQNAQAALTAALDAAKADGVLSGSQAMDLVRAWLAGKAAATGADAPAVLQVTYSALAARAGGGFSAAANPVSSWADIGALQFGQGLLSRGMAGSAAAASLSVLGLPGLSTISELFAYTLSASSNALNIPFTVAQVQEFFGVATNPAKLGGLVMALQSLTANPAGAATILPQITAMAPNFFGAVPAPSLTSFLPILAAFTTVQIPKTVANLTVEMRFAPQAEYRAQLDAQGVLPNNGGFFTRHTAQEIIFGYNAGTDPFLALTNYGGLFGPLYTTQAAYTASFGSKTPPFHALYTGLGNYGSQGRYVMYNDKRVMVTREDLGQSCPADGSDCRLWLSPEVIHGSFDGNAWDPIHEDDTPYPVYRVYNHDSYRVLNLTYKENVSFKGIDLRRYVVDMACLTTQSVNPDNKNYRMTDPTGVATLAAGKSGAPLFMSTPHFLMGDPSLPAQFKGLNPSTALHGTMLDVEPITGRTFYARKRLQVVVGLSNTMFNLADTDRSGLFKQATMLYWPSGWAEEGGEINDDDADTFKSKIYGAYWQLYAVAIAFLVLGGVGILVAIILYCIVQRDLVFSQHIQHVGGSELPHMRNDSKPDYKPTPGTAAAWN